MSDWSSDVFSSDLASERLFLFRGRRLGDPVGGVVGIDLLRIALVRVLIFLDVLLEGLQPTAEIPHQAGDLAAPAEQNEDHYQNDEPMPATEATHRNSPSCSRQRRGPDRKSGVQGKSVSVRVDRGGGRISKNKTT